MKKHEQRQRDREIRRGLHSERVVNNPRYYIEKNNHDNYRTFKKQLVQYQDQDGRLYKEQPLDLVRTDSPVLRPKNAPYVQLDVKLPPGVPDFPTSVVTRFVAHLEPLKSGLPPRTVRIHQIVVMPGHRSGHVLVTRAHWKNSLY